MSPISLVGWAAAFVAACALAALGFAVIVSTILVVRKRFER